VEDAGADFLHVDAVKPGYKNADYNVISSIKDNTDIFLIGNNSINNIKSARKMITAGADGISMARSLKNGIIPFDLSLV
jgi:TIM-barrel protein